MKNPIKNHVLVFRYDLAKYPPILSIIEVLLSQNTNIYYIGECSDTNLYKRLQEKGVNFSIFKNDINENIIFKFIHALFFVRYVKKIMSTQDVANTQLWILGVETVWLLNKLSKAFKSVLYLFETPLFNVPFSHKFFCSDKSYYDIMQNPSSKVVCCEYNRAHITKAFFGMENLPYIIPNKPLYPINELEDSDLLKEYESKKILLYQGIFNYPERQLDDFCRAMDYLSDEYVLVLMGGPENAYRKKLREEYQSSKIVFLPFIAPPKHLSITKSAYIGILSYFPAQSHSISSSLNVLYCAPNKIYEYSCFGIPMISNDLPALSHAFSLHGAGLCCDVGSAPQSIAKAVQEIDANYISYSKCARELYESVDVRSLLLKLISDEL